LIGKHYQAQPVRSLVNSILLLVVCLLIPVASKAAIPIDQESTTPEVASEAASTEHVYKYRVEHGQFRTASGAYRNYLLYVPEPTAGLPSGPFPLVVLIHGFLMTGHQHSGNAENFAKHGFIAFAPDLTKVLLGDDTRMENVNHVLQEIRWLTNQNEDSHGPLLGLVDINRVGIAGNSAGGAVCLELLLEAQKAKVPIKAMCSLDGVPWDRTWDRIAQLEPVNLLSLRAEPGLCNYHARILNYFALLKFRVDDVKVNGAHHCDVENPTTLGCRCVCGVSDEKHRRMFQRLTYLYFRDTLKGLSMDNERDTFAQAVHGLAQDGQVIAKLDQLEPPALASRDHSR
jgi:pimeloyl-ACP methyl ester carboxylesterase